jgi:hypothetical protein
MSHIKWISMNRKLFWMQFAVRTCMKMLRVHSMNTMNIMYSLYKDRHMEEFTRFMSHIKLISMIRRLLWMHL